MKMPAC